MTTRIRAATEFQLKRKHTGSTITKRCHGCLDGMEVVAAVTADEHCRQLRESGFSLDLGSLKLVPLEQQSEV